MTHASFQKLNRKIAGGIVHHDQDGVFTGHRWLQQLVVKDKIRISYSEDGAKGNVYMESFNGRFKEENRSIFWEQEDFASLWEVVKSRVRYYNRVRRHSALGYKSPIEYLKKKGILSR
jgi:putative transposase